MPKLSPLEIDAINHQKLINQELANLCRMDEDDGVVSKIEKLIGEGAEVCYQNSKPLYNATKKVNFRTIYKLIDHGALNDPMAINYIASICNYRNFKKNEEKFFALIDHCIELNGFDITYFVPYINTMFLHGQAAKTNLLITKYKLSSAQIIDCVYERVIFEIINNGHEPILEYIERNRDWISQTVFDTAVASGEYKVLKYLLSKNLGIEPQESALNKAIYDGSTEILDLLKSWGYPLKKNPNYLRQACRSFYTKGKKAFEYLMNNGFSLTDTYDGMTIAQNAERDGNKPLLDYLYYLETGILRS